MKADLHIHSTHSFDSVAKPESILSVAAQRGIDIIAITDHDSCEAWQDFNSLKYKYPVQIIYGQEIKIVSHQKSIGELICLFLEKPIKSITVNDIVKEVKSQNGIVSIAHPFSSRRNEFRAFGDIEDWDDLAIEVLNGRTYKKTDNEMASNLAQRLNSQITAGSDAHTPFEVGTCYLEFNGSTPNDLKKAIQHHQVLAVGNTSPVLYSVISGFGRIGLSI